MCIHTRTYILISLLMIPVILYFYILHFLFNNALWKLLQVYSTIFCFSHFMCLSQSWNFYILVHICLILEEYKYFKHIFDIVNLYSIKKSHMEPSTLPLSEIEKTFLSLLSHYKWIFYHLLCLNNSFRTLRWFAEYFIVFVCD